MTNIQKKFNVGDTVHWSDVNSRSGELSNGKVTKVGTKLVTVGRRTFRLDNLRTNDEYGHQMLVLDVQAYKDEKKADQLSMELSEHLRRNKIRLDTLIEVAEKLGVTYEIADQR